MQIHTPNETNDNIVAYWVPEQLPAPGEPLDFAYRLHWQGARRDATAAGSMGDADARRARLRELADNELQYIVDFTGPSLAAFPAERACQGRGVGAGERGDRRDQRLLRRGHRRVANDGSRQAARRDEAHRAARILQHGDDVLTETWSNLVPPR